MRCSRRQLRCRGRRLPPPAKQPPRRVPDIEDEYVGADEEHDESLDDVREVARQLRLDDGARVEPVRSPEEKPAEEQRAQQGAEGGIAPEESHGDAEEAHLAERDVECAELVVRGAAEHVDPAGETRKAPEIAIARIRFFLTLMPPYAAASGLKPTALTS